MHMKKWLALAACIVIDAGAGRYALAQHTTRSHSISARSPVAFLGVGVAEIDDDRAKALNLKEDHGVVVMSVGDNTPAAKAGLKQSDVILEFNGDRVEGVEQFQRMVRETPANRKVTLLIDRSGSSRTVIAQLASHVPQNFGTFEFEMPEMPEMPSVTIPPMPPMPPVVIDTPRALLSWQQGAIGIEIEPVNGQLASYFGVKDGVLVRAVTRNSPAERAGMRAGDVVTHVRSNLVHTPQDVSRELRAARGNNDSVSVALMRNHREMTLSVKLAGEDE